MPRFFKVEAESAHITEEAIIRQLIMVRLSGYKPSVAMSITHSDCHAAEIMVKRIGRKILGANFPEDMATLSSLIEQFDARMHVLLATPDKYRFIVFSAQLLQYYTLLCNEDFDPNESALNFYIFLNKNKKILGQTDNNLFVAEYIIIKSYNDLNNFLDAATGITAPIANLEEKAKLTLNRLEELKIRLEQWRLDAPDDIFIDYLDFSLNYSRAKAAELIFTLQEKTLNDEEKIGMADLQMLFLNEALLSLRRFEDNNQYHKERKTPLYPGAEYSLGPNLFSKFPVDNIETIKSHLLSLTQSHSS
jgi:hypothetical protein